MMVIKKLQTIKENKHPRKSPAASLPNINAIVIRTKQIVIIVIKALSRPILGVYIPQISKGLRVVKSSLQVFFKTKA